MSVYKINGALYRHYTETGHCFRDGIPCEMSELMTALHNSRMIAQMGGVA